MCLYVPAVDPSYLTREQGPLKRRFLSKITLATTYMIYYKALRETFLYILNSSQSGRGWIFLLRCNHHLAYFKCRICNFSHSA